MVGKDEVYLPMGVRRASSSEWGLRASRSAREAAAASGDGGGLARGLPSVLAAAASWGSDLEDTAGEAQVWGRGG